MLFSRIIVKHSVINVLSKRSNMISGYLSSQNEIAFIPKSWEILEYKLTMSNETMIECSGTS